MGTMFVSEGVWWRWFAWRPVHLESGGWVWLRYVERRKVHYTVPEIGLGDTLNEYRQVAV